MPAAMPPSVTTHDIGPNMPASTGVATAEATALSGVMLVEVTDRGPEVVARLRAAGAQVEAADEAGNLFTLTQADEAVLDAVAAVAADLGVGLVRMQRRRHHLTEMFREGAA